MSSATAAGGLRFAGQGNHAGTTLMSDRRDPMVAAGATIAQIRASGVDALETALRSLAGRS